MVLRPGESETKPWFYQASWERLNYHRERLRKLTSRALALRQSEMTKDSDERPTLETSACSIFHGGNSTFINSLVKPNFSAH